MQIICAFLLNFSIYFNSGESKLKSNPILSIYLKQHLPRSVKVTKMRKIA